MAGEIMGQKPMVVFIGLFSAQSWLIPCDPMDCSPPVFSVHQIFQARILDWVAISFSNIVWLLLLLLSRFSRVRLCATP